ncbi:hypothetical protein HU200_048661 [Digitaria exilis]|uniref:Uncharacterized protein n=1 Tax=Digitaria exilis TaxID=1010633 RepID=A0A835AW66_9POAL|nr:hypothetical protein HU200_048661 [Digitaria exilis]
MESSCVPTTLTQQRLHIKHILKRADHHQPTRMKRYSSVMDHGVLVPSHRHDRKMLERATKGSKNQTEEKQPKPSASTRRVSPPTPANCDPSHVASGAHFPPHVTDRRPTTNPPWLTCLPASHPISRAPRNHHFHRPKVSAVNAWAPLVPVLAPGLHWPVDTRRLRLTASAGEKATRWDPCVATPFPTSASSTSRRFPNTPFHPARKPQLNCARGLARSPAMSKPQDADIEAAVPAVAEKGAKAGQAPAAAAGKKKKVTPAAAEAEPAAPTKKVAEEEDPRLRWAFVRKVYAVLSLQFALTAAVSIVACYVRAIPRFFVDGPAAAVWPVFIFILLSPLIGAPRFLPLSSPPYCLGEKHPANLVLLGVFTLCCSLSIAVSTSTTLVSVVGLTLFTFWAVKKGYEFTFMFPFLFTCLHVLLVYIFIQIFFPLGRVGMTIYVLLATLVFSGFIVFDTHMLLKRHTYNEYVITAISLYLDVINLFMAQMSLSIQ